MDEAVLLAVDDQGVAELTLNRPDQKNAMSREVLDAFAEAIRAVRKDARVRAVLVRGEGRHFCTGADLRGGIATLARDLSGGAAELRKVLREAYDPFLSILDVEVPTVAAVHGAAVGGGLGLALACDLRLCAEDARFQANFVRLGIHPGMAVTWFLPRLVGDQRAAEILFTGRPLTGLEAATMGLVLRAVRSSALLEEARALARAIAQGAPQAMRLTKASLRRARGEDPRRFADWEALAQARTAETDDAREGIAAWFEKRPPAFTGK